MSRQRGIASNETAQHKLRAQQKSQQELAVHDLRAVMGSPVGRRFVWRLIEAESGAFGPSYAQDALATAFNEGRRQLGINLMRACQQFCPDSYLKALDEQLLSQRAEASVRADAQATPSED